MADKNRGALNLLATYGSTDDSSDEDVPGPRVSTKRTASKEWSDSENRKVLCTKAEKVLPLPETVLTLFKKPDDTPVDDPIEHDGRVRSFPHERGNWVTYVYVPYDPGPVVQSLVDVLIACFEDNVSLRIVKDMHISLTRTVVLRHHWIGPFIDSVRERIQGRSSFRIGFGSLAVYTNDEKTRTFVGLTVHVGAEATQKVVCELDQCLEEFKLPKFYENPSFHMSIAWCLGDQKEVLESQMAQMDLVFQQFVHAHPFEWFLDVNELKCKTGNKEFSFRLTT